jgi:starch synthase
LKTIEDSWYSKIHTIFSIHNLGYQEKFSIYILLMPSIYEPYGLDDSIQPFDGKTGTGFKFAPNDRKSFQQALQKSIVWFADKHRWDRLINNDMDMDFSWDIAAQQYSSLFRDIQPNH